MQRHASHWTEAEPQSCVLQAQSLSLQFPSDRHCDLSHVLHQFLELARFNGFFTVTQRTFRVRMDFDQNAVRSRSHGGFRHRRHQIPLAGGMAGIDDDGQMRQFF